MDLRSPGYRSALRRVADAQAALISAEGRLREAAVRASGSSSDTALRELARCELHERRARAAVERSRAALAATRERILQDRASVPAGFRRRTDLEPRVLSLYGRAVPGQPPAAAGDGSARPRAASRS